MFKESKPIFIQLKEQIENQILAEEYATESKIPSVRETAAEFEVNNNTVMRAYEALTREETIYAKRGMGYFVCNNAKNNILERRKELFLKETLPELIEQLNILNIKDEELTELLDKIRNKSI